MNIRTLMPAAKPGAVAASLALVLAFAGPREARPQGPAPAAVKGAAVVPFEMLPSNHMVVKARINGKGPYRLIFDLGAPITLLGNRAGEGSGVVKKSAPKSFLFSMRGESKVDTLEVGGLKATALPVIVLDHPALTALGTFLGGPLDGIIGFTFFARYRTTIDYKVNEMTFEPVDFRVKDLMKDLPERLVGPKVGRTRVLAPGAFFGLTVGAPSGGLDSPGVPVTGVLEGSPAAEAGLRVGDLLAALDGRWTADVGDVYSAAAASSPGRTVAVDVVRDGQPVTLKVTPRAGF